MAIGIGPNIITRRRGSAALVEQGQQRHHLNLRPRVRNEQPHLTGPQRPVRSQSRLSHRRAARRRSPGRRRPATHPSRSGTSPILPRPTRWGSAITRANDRGVAKAASRRMCLPLRERPSPSAPSIFLWYSPMASGCGIKAFDFRASDHLSDAADGHMVARRRHGV